jgi:hypothetical protein
VKIGRSPLTDAKLSFPSLFFFAFEPFVANAFPSLKGSRDFGMMRTFCGWWNLGVFYLEGKLPASA